MLNTDINPTLINCLYNISEMPEPYRDLAISTLSAGEKKIIQTALASLKDNNLKNETELNRVALQLQVKLKNKDRSLHKFLVSIPKKTLLENVEDDPVKGYHTLMSNIKRCLDTNDMENLISLRADGEIEAEYQYLLKESIRYHGCEKGYLTVDVTRDDLTIQQKKEFFDVLLPEIEKYIGSSFILNLSNFELNEELLKRLIDVCAKVKLKDFAFEKSKLNDSQVKLLSPLWKVESLEEVRLGANQITLEGVKTLKQLHDGNPRIKVLLLDNGLQDEDWIELANLPEI